MSIKDFFSAGPGRAFVIIALVVCAASFYVGRGMGYDTGHAVASISANTVAEANYQEGYDAGKEEGHDAGYKEGVQATRENYEAKLEAEYSKGYDAGEAKGHAEGYDEGYKAAYAEQADIGTEDQYRAGEAPQSSSGESSPAPAPEPESESEPAPAEPDATTVAVFVTNTGGKYHRYGCRYLRESKNNISLAEAISRGYEPCSVCDPPVYNP